MIQPLKNIANLSTTLQRGTVATEKVFRIIEQPVDIVDSPNASVLEHFNHSIKLKNISFKYHDKYVIDHLTLEIPKGKSIALVGASGSGKSTLVDLICRFYDANSGSIEIDNHNVKDITIHSLREKISLVSQGTFLFNDTIANNISFGLTNITQQQIIEAAKVANAHEFIVQSQNGYDTIVGESGVKLSGGQKQRITIARAVLKNAPILILDEATSALDSESEKLVQQAIENITKNRTSIVVAHRLSTIKNADEIIVMGEGKIIERGSHEALIKQNGTYKKLVDLQEIS
jgi:subfamily B ATP-binding cassette protein MsbA